MEVCVDLIQSVLNAVNGGARRLELCSSLGVGGLTPTVGFFRVCRELVPADCKLFVMIRTRPGDFNYSENELRVMVEDVRAFREAGADGFVFGCLDADGDVNVEHCERLLREAHPAPCTFHRAFDSVREPLTSLPVIERLGFARILTSGQKETAFSGRDLIKTLIDRCRSCEFKVIVMPGCGVNENNLETILRETGAREFHGSAKDAAAKPGVCLTCEDTVRKMVRIGSRFGCDYQ
ncbi:UNVERIFIED_CONTAM: hypothetical protein PYX00_004225 [Menopon gallinae]|uniref:Copper homeostasis protein cutC homolog n=1 Tax=Menopon gallinae TaxID=328185 RepID=A0AAW2I4H1_9NEOP